MSALEGCEISSIFGSFIVGEAAPEQVWSLNLTEGSGVRLTLTSAFDGAIYIRSGAACATAALYDEGCVDSAGADDTESSAVGYLEAGQYWIVVDSYDEITDPAYTLNLEIVTGGFCVADPVDDDPSGTHNTLATAIGPIGTQTDDNDQPADVTLNICPDDEDWFLIYNSGGDVTVHAVPAAGGTGTLAAELQAVTRPATGDPTGTVVTGTTYTGGNLVATALAPGEYAIHVSATGIAARGLDYGFNVLFACEADAAEVRRDAPPGNNTLATAYPPLVTQRDDAGAAEDVPLSICPTDEDWFLVYTSGGDLTVRAVAATGATGTVDVELQSVTRDTANVPTGTVVSTGVTVTAGVLTATALPAGEYAAKMSGTSTPGSGTAYGFNFLFSCEPDFFEFHDAGEPQGNGTETTAVALPAIPEATPADARLCPGDVEFYWLKVDGAGDATVKLFGGGDFTVETLIATVTDGKVTGASGSATSTIVQSGTNNVDKTITITGAAAGSNYLVKVVQGATAPPAAGTAYTISAALPPPPNDTCANAQSITLPAVGAEALRVAGTTVNAASNSDATTAECTGSTAEGPDVYYTFTAPATPVKVTVRTSNEEFDSVVYVLDGSCTGAEVACNDDETNSIYSSLVEFTTTASATYIIVVDSYRNPGEFELVVSTGTP